MPRRKSVIRSAGAIKILVAPSAFKGTYGPFEVASVMARGIRRALPQISTHVLPIADGGDGTFEVLSTTLKANQLTATVFDPLMRPVRASWGLTPEGTAVIEMAAASGLKLLKTSERDILRTSSFGTGQLIREAIAHNARQIFLGVGGTASADGGMGALSALGFRFLDSAGNILSPGGGSLRALHSIDTSYVLPVLHRVAITIACDVTNPLTGPSGSARVFGPQKGAGPGEVKILEEGLARLTRTIRSVSGRSVLGVPRTGAAGGIAGSFWGLKLARLVSGFDLIAEYTQLKRWVRWADLILTGEGSLDSQSFSGKAIGELAALASKSKTRVLALAPHVNVPPQVARRFPGLKVVRLGDGRHHVSLGQIERATLKIVEFNRFP